MTKFRRLQGWTARTTASSVKSLKVVSWKTSQTLKQLLVFDETNADPGVTSRDWPSFIQCLNPFYWIGWLWLFMLRYFESRHFTSLLQGVPAIVGIITLLLMPFWKIPVSQQIAQTRNRMLYLKDQEKLEGADFFARKLCFLAPENPEPLFHRVLILDQMGKSSEATQIAVELGNSRRHIPAVEWLCQQQFAKLQLQSSGAFSNQPEMRSWVLNNLNFILEYQPENHKANLMLATLQMMNGSYALALQPMQMAVNTSPDDNPELVYSLAVINQKLGNIEASKRLASQAADGLVSRMSYTEPDVPITTKAVGAFIVAEREEDAIRLLEQQIPNAAKMEKQQLTWLMAEIYARWGLRLDSSKDGTPNELIRSLGLVGTAVRLAPTHPVVAEHLVRICCNKAATDKETDLLLERALQSGVSPGLVHFITGTRLLTADVSQPEAALREFELAAAHDVDMPGLLNNMADAIVEAGDAELGIALKLVNRALASLPNQPEFLDTRGKIYLKLKKNILAIADFERALVKQSLRPAVHKKLAEAHKALGNEDMARKHLSHSENHN